MPAVPSVSPFAAVRRLLSGRELLLAILPALIVSICAVAFNHFALIDDGVQIAAAKGPLRYIFITDGGRFFPLYYFYNWLSVRILPICPWAFSMANGVFLVIAAYQVWALARRWSGPLAGIASAWFFTLNLATIENFFTLGKAEPKQLVFWLLALRLLVDALDTDVDEGRIRKPAMLLMAVLAALLIKETAILLSVPFGLFALLTLSDWKQLSSVARRYRLCLLVAGIIPLSFSLITTLRIGMRDDSYARQRVMKSPFTESSSLLPLLRVDALLTILLLAGSAAALYLMFIPGPRRRSAIAVIGVQLFAIFGFFTLIQARMLYYYYPAAALASIFVGITLFPAAASPRWKAISAMFSLSFLAYCISLSFAGAAALSGWSWLHDRLTRAVITEKPARVFFYQAGSWEVHQEAKVVWNGLHKLPVQIGVFATEKYSEPAINIINPRELRSGDWILEEFGTAENSRIPFRDLNVNLTQNYGLATQPAQSLWPIALRHQFTAHFPLPTNRWFPRYKSTTFLQWRIYEVNSTPRFIAEDIDADRWMGKTAAVWIKSGSPPVVLRFQPYVPPQGFGDSHLLIFAGKQLIVDCPVAKTGITICRFDPAQVAANQIVDGWMHLELRASKTFCPKELGISADTRNFSYNFGPTWAAGLPGLFSEPADKTNLRLPPGKPVG